MEKQKRIVARGQQLIQLLNSVDIKTLELIKSDLGDMTFANCDLIRLIDYARDNREKKDIENLDTISMEPPEFWD